MRWTFAPLIVLAAGAGSAHAVQYLTIEQAQKLLFPAAAEFSSAELLMTDAQRQAVSQASGMRVRDARVRAWAARDAQGGLLGRVLLDEVTGKHDLITYVVAVSPEGRVIGIEILDYRENYGGQIREAAWRAQFRGKTARDALKVDADITNISGATLSCSHVADGVRRLLATNELVLNLRPA
jgi:Na+-translocating ferredoxin:NAD+ oxidoreductase RnfG subunit